MNDMILVSVDDHVIEPPNAFIDYFPERLKARAPRIETVAGKDFWTWEGRRYPSIGLNAVVGRPRNEYGMEPSAYDQMREGCYDQKARLDDMNVNGIFGSLCFPTFPTTAGSVFLAQPDREVALAAVRAYNDWNVHDWCGGEARGRLIPLSILPLWDIEQTVAEIERMSALGVHAVSFPDNPTKHGLPSIHNAYWEPFWKACSDHRMVINCHIGSGGPAAHASEETPIDAWITTMPMSIANSAADWTFGSFWKRYPDLRMALSEGGIGWIPYFLERADFSHEHHREWTFTSFGGDKPSDVFKRHIITCFIDDRFGVKNLDSMNEDMVCWECDYPHSDTVWPNCPEYLWACVKQLPKAMIDKITHGNVVREYSYDPFSLFAREDCTVGALRAKAGHVNVEPRIGLGGLNAAQDLAASRPITSGDLIKMFAKA
jgi:predicted TIM-barrel fold metal-dependent hydrolase